MVVAGAEADAVVVKVGSFAYAGHAIVVDRDNLYAVNDYRSVRATNINAAAIVNNYQAAPVISNRVIANYAANKQRYNYAAVPVSERPRPEAVARIIPGDKIARAGRENAAAIAQQAKIVRQGSVSNQAHVAQPKGINPAPAGRARQMKPMQPGQAAPKNEGQAQRSPGGAAPLAAQPPAQRVSARPEQPSPAAAHPQQGLKAKQTAEERRPPQAAQPQPNQHPQPPEARAAQERPQGGPPKAPPAQQGRKKPEGERKEEEKPRQ
jgi:hypothetical protein